MSKVCLLTKYRAKQTHTWTPLISFPSMWLWLNLVKCWALARYIRKKTFPRLSDYFEVKRSWQFWCWYQSRANIFFRMSWNFMIYVNSTDAKHSTNLKKTPTITCEMDLTKTSLFFQKCAWLTSQWHNDSYIWFYLSTFAKVTLFRGSVRATSLQFK